MNSYLNYLLEFNVCVSILGMSYYVLLKGETDFRFRRSYIIIGVLLCLIAPFLKLGSWGYSSGAELNAISTMILPELVIGDSLTSTHTDTPWYQYSFILYGIIAAILLQVFLFQLFQVAWFALSSKTRIQRMKNY